MQTAKQEGLDEGISIGEARGEAKGIASVANSMIEAGMADEQIATLTKLDIGEVAALRANLAAEN